MLFKKLFLLLLCVVGTTANTFAEGYGRHLTSLQIERVRAVKTILEGVDKKSLSDTIHEIEKNRHPEVSLQMKEAMAQTYADIVREIDVRDKKKKEWLYSMVCLNMAYLQFGGSSKNKPGSTTELNRLIRQKLVKYLPSDIVNSQGFLYVLE
ncbi:MAG: hypothetical protein HQL13_05415 [Candidatus Omnitrophica bacterium]|nr:hypothetical protein [Candidatus Omnitrophota bacterium]